MQIPRWRNVLILRSSLVPCVSDTISSTKGIQFAAIHSSPVTCVKWKNKWNDDVRKPQQPSKNCVRYAVRQKRADAKRALKGLLYNTGNYRPFQDADPMSSFDAESLGSTSKTRRQKNTAKSSRKSYQKKIKSKFRREYYSQDDDEPGPMFQARFGNKWFTWSFHHSSFEDSRVGFEWREPPKWTNCRAREWDTSYAESDDTSDAESDYGLCSIGLTSERTILGLPPTGPLKINDVKNAFRLSALKWHPDKHQGPSQAAAEEKFKLCVNAYKSLCTALS